MFLEFFWFELRYRFSRISTNVYIFFMFMAGFLAIISSAGVFTGVTVGVNVGASEKMILNSAYFNNLLFSGVSLILIFFVSAFMSDAIYRDFNHNTFQFFYTKPIRKRDYLLGRFVANLLTTAVIMLAALLGLLAGSFFPGLEKTYFGSTNIINYLNPYLITVLPNILFMGSLFFAIAIFTRKSFTVYVSAVILFFGYSLATEIMENLDNKLLASLIDPFGLITFLIYTEKWTMSDINSRLINFNGYLLWNRLLWIFLSFMILIIAYVKFHLSYSSGTIRKKKVTENNGTNLEKKQEIRWFDPKLSFSPLNQVIQLTTAIRIELQNLLRNSSFYIITFAGLIVTTLILSESGKIYGTAVRPTTYLVSESVRNGFMIISILVVTIFIAEMLWKDRETRINLMKDALPVKDWLYYLPRLISINIVVMMIYVICSIMGVGYQLISGFTDIKPDVYLSSILLNFVSISLYTFVIMCIHILVNNKYIGHIVVLAFYFLVPYVAKFGLKHPLFQFGSGLDFTYSDMNGYGNFLYKYMWYAGFWASLCLLLAVISYLFVVRGSDSSFKNRWKVARERFKAVPEILTSLAVIGMLSTGGYIVYNTNYLREFLSDKAVRQRQADYEKMYGKYRHVPQPKYTDIFLQVDFFPERQEADFKGKLVMENKTSVPIDSLHLIFNDLLETNEITFSKDAVLAYEDEKYGYKVYKFSDPLQPGEKCEMNFSNSYRRKGFQFWTKVVENGSFVDNYDFMPAIGYNFYEEIMSEKDRKKFGLPARERRADVDDLNARQNNYITDDADWVNYEAIIGTSPDQIAVTSGYLQRDWQENGRRYFHYKMDQPIICYTSFSSARYAVDKDIWKAEDGREVNIEIYYHPQHKYNIPRMITSLKKTLDYCDINFSPYQHKQIRILEFPRYASFAQSFANTIPYSEAIGFVADVKGKENEVDYPFEITSHELAHQWWAHQVIGANVKGAELMSEVLAQYSSIMILKEEYGEKAVRKFLEHEVSRYLSGRSSEDLSENPLCLVEGQGYIHYNKGSVIMYALQDYIGEENLNREISKYLYAVRYQNPPYTNSTEFLPYLKAATPDSLAYLIPDMFEKITIYDIKTDEVTYSKNENGSYTVNLSLFVNKLYADSDGKETEAEDFRDLIEIGIFNKNKENEDPLYMKKLWMTPGNHKISIIVDSEPGLAGIDPYNKLIDKESSNNLLQAKQI